MPCTPQHHTVFMNCLFKSNIDLGSTQEKKLKDFRRGNRCIQFGLHGGVYYGKLYVSRNAEIAASVGWAVVG